MLSKKEIFNNNNGRIHDDYQYGIEVTEICYNTPDSALIYRLICAQEFANVDQRIYAEEIVTDQDDSSSDLHNEASSLIDEANITPTSSINAPKCVKIQLSEDRRLSDEIFKLFPGLSEQEVVNLLKKVQDEIDKKIWAKIDKKYEKNVMTSEISSQIYREFKKELKSYLFKEFPTQEKSINAARLILEQSSFGILFCNMKNEVLGVQNHHGSWSAVKGHPKIKDDGTWETPCETCVRELFEELSIKLKRSKREKTITKENIDLLCLNKTNFFQCYVDTRPNTNDRLRLIGLFYVRIDEKKFKFSLKDNKENKACGWLNINDMLSNKPERGRDIYHTLRPFVQYLIDEPIL